MAVPTWNAISTRLMINSQTIGDAMTDLSTIATAIEIGLERGMTGEQAVNLLRQIRDQIRTEERDERERLELSRSRWSKIVPLEDQP
jgi:hypothetical protein